MDADPAMSFAAKTFKEPFAPLGVQTSPSYDGGASVTFNSGGSVAWSDHGASPPNWFEVPSSGIGASYWIRLHKTGGSRVLNANDNVWVSLNTSPTYSVSGGAGNVTGTLDFSTDSSGTTIVGSTTFSVNNTL